MFAIGANERLNLRLAAAREDAVQRVVILRRDRIELVIVAARAGDRQAEEALRHDVDAVVDDVVLHSLEPLADREEAERGEVARVLRPGGELVRRELLRDEDVVRHVVVEARIT